MRSIFIKFSIVAILSASLISYFWNPFVWSFIVLIPLILVGINDMIQTKQTIRRNFPVLGRMRYWMENLRPKIYQYFIESDTDGTPFDRQNRNVIYQRAKKVNDTTPFGTQLNTYAMGYEWLNHSIVPLDAHKMEQHPRVLIGGQDCKQPYSASILNISAMSFGSLSQNAILSLNSGAKIGNFAHNTGEGGLSPYHLEPGGDIIWQIGTGYFGCRNADGTFNADLFAERAVLPNVKMIEIKLSQGAKPGHGGILPAKKVTPEISKIRLVEMGKDVLSPPFHTAFNTPEGLLNFVKLLRERSGGKPVGFKLCIGRKSQFLAICKSMVKTGIMPDFITIDGGEGGTGAAPLEFSNSVGMPLRDAIAFAYDALNGFSLKRHIKIIASGKVVTGFDLIKNISLGADLCNSARAMMMSLGCIQALECNTNRCPTGIATQDKNLQKGIVVEDKKIRVANYHNETIKSAVELMAAAGIDDIKKLHRALIYRRVSHGQIQTYGEAFPYILKGCLLEAPYPEQYVFDMINCNEDTFEPLIK
ncbi:MAG: FMN-binding glutamate synthase family protein [Flavobacteriales bacterium]|nr:FMN-binding glutamate synthase family protein [Flavobacteriales bacterium]